MAKLTNRDMEYIRELEHTYGSLSNSPNEKLKYLTDRHAAAEPTESRKPHRRWTDDEIAYLRKHYHTKTRTEIADYLGRPPKKVTDRASYMGLRKEKRYVYDKDELKRLAKEGYTISEITKKMKLTKSTVYGYLLRNNIDFRRTKHVGS